MKIDSGVLGGIGCILFALAFFILGFLLHKNEEPCDPSVSDCSTDDNQFEI